MAGIGDIIAIYLYGQVAMCTGNLIHYHVDDRLRETDGITRHHRKLFRHFLDQVGLCLAELPGIIRLQTDSTLDMGKGESFGSLIVTPDLGHYIGDFFKLFHCFTQLGSHLLRLLYGDTRRQLHLYPDRPFVERRQEVFSYRITQHTGSHQDHKQRHQHTLRFVQQRDDLLMVDIPQLLQPAVVINLARLAVGIESQPRNQEQGNGQGTQQSITYSISHRGKELLLDMLESEQGKIGCDNN